MHAYRLHVECKLKTSAGKSIREFNILGAPQVLVETTGS